MKRFMETFRSGKYEVITPDQMNDLLVEYDLSPQAFSKIIGVDEQTAQKYLLESSNSSHLDMEYSQVRLFLIWTRLVRPELRPTHKRDFFARFKEQLHEDQSSIEIFSKKELGISKETFNQLKDENPEILETLIRFKIDI